MDSSESMIERMAEQLATTTAMREKVEQNPIGASRPVE